MYRLSRHSPPRARSREIAELEEIFWGAAFAVILLIPIAAFLAANAQKGRPKAWGTLKWLGAFAFSVLVGWVLAITTTVVIYAVASGFDISNAPGNISVVVGLLLFAFPLGLMAVAYSVLRVPETPKSE